MMPIIPLSTKVQIKVDVSNQRQSYDLQQWETPLQLSTKVQMKVDVSNQRQPYDLQQWETPLPWLSYKIYNDDRATEPAGQNQIN